MTASLRALKHIARMAYGDALAQAVREDGEVPVFGSNGIAGQNSIPNTLSPAIIIGRKGSFGKVTWTAVPGFCIDTAYYIDRRHTDANLRWLYWALQTLDLDVHSEDTGVPGLSRDKAYQTRLRVPQRDEQERIADFLDEKTARIDALIAEKEALLERLQRHQFSSVSDLMMRGLRANVAMMSTGFPELSEVPAHWQVKRLKFLGDVRSGIAKGKDHGDRETVSLPYLRVANVQDGYLDLSEVLDIEVEAHEVERFLLKKGDVLMNEGGDNDKLGRGTVWEGQIDPCVHQNHVFAVRLYDPQLAEWVARFTSTHAARAYFYSRSKQSTNLASINQSNVRELPVPLPPEAERRQILEEVRRSSSANTDLVAHVADHIGRLLEYRASLISAAVTGQLDLGSV